MSSKRYPPILPTPLKGKLKKEDIVRAVDAARAARLKKLREERSKRSHG